MSSRNESSILSNILNIEYKGFHNKPEIYVPLTFKIKRGIPGIYKNRI